MNKLILIISFSLVNIISSQEYPETNNVETLDNNQLKNENTLTIHFLDKSMPIYTGEASRSIEFNYNFGLGSSTSEGYNLEDYNPWTFVSVYHIDKVIYPDGKIIKGEKLRKHERIYSSTFNIIIMSIFINLYLIE